MVGKISVLGLQNCLFQCKNDMKNLAGCHNSRDRFIKSKASYWLIFQFKLKLFLSLFFFFKKELHCDNTCKTTPYAAHHEKTDSCSGVIQVKVVAFFSCSDTNT